MAVQKAILTVLLTILFATDVRTADAQEVNRSVFYEGNIPPSVGSWIADPRDLYGMTLSVPERAWRNSNLLALNRELRKKKIKPIALQASALLSTSGRLTKICLDSIANPVQTRYERAILNFLKHQSLSPSISHQPVKVKLTFSQFGVADLRFIQKSD